MNKKCVFILPYFGNFKNYFQLFLNSFSRNTSYDLLIFTDNTNKYDYPENVKVIKYTLDTFRQNANKKFGFSVSLNAPYKLCDYKPSYGFLFEEYIADYPYWGFCDCDLIFGNLEEILTPLLDEGYDKLFAAGHMTVFKNNYDNNSRFMKPLDGRYLYKEAYTTDKIFVFDEDYKCDRNPDGSNVHGLFLNDDAKVFQTDLSMNPTARHARFKRAYYSEQSRTFLFEDDIKTARYFWNNGNITEALYNKDDDKIEYINYLYLHLQQRKMRIKNDAEGSDIIEILPDRFVRAEKIPQNKQDMRLATIKCSYLYYIDRYLSRIKRRKKAEK